MADTLIELGGVALILTGFGLLVAAAATVAVALALVVAGAEGLLSGGVLIALASARQRSAREAVK